VDGHEKPQGIVKRWLPLLRRLPWTTTSPLSDLASVSRQVKAQLVGQSHLIALSLVCKDINASVRDMILASVTLRILPLIISDGSGAEAWASWDYAMNFTTMLTRQAEIEPSGLSNLLARIINVQVPLTHWIA
jgi:hypothetical protein